MTTFTLLIWAAYTTCTRYARLASHVALGVPAASSRLVSSSL